MSKKTVSLIEGLHITATDKRHILAIVEKGWSSGHTKQRSYEIETNEDGSLQVVIERRERDDYGRMQIRTSRIKVMVGEIRQTRS